MTIVPEIDLPGHAQAVLAAYPELGDGDAVEVWTRWGISEHVLEPGGRRRWTSPRRSTAYVAGLFPGSPVHIGGDECPTTQWEASEGRPRGDGARTASATRASSRASSPPRVAAALRARGHEVLAWDEVLDADVPPGTVVVAWRSGAKGAEAARRGLDVVMAPDVRSSTSTGSTPTGPASRSPSTARPGHPLGEGLRFLGVPDGLEPGARTTACAARRPSCGPSTSRRATTWTTWPSRGSRLRRGRLGHDDVGERVPRAPGSASRAARRDGRGVPSARPA